jgi:hypothetical protein
MLSELPFKLVILRSPETLHSPLPPVNLALHLLYRPGRPYPYRPFRGRGGIGRRARAGSVERLSKVAEGSMKRDLDRVRLQPQHFTDLPCRQIRPVTETDQVPLALRKRIESDLQAETPRGICLEISRCRRLHRISQSLPTGDERIVDAPSRNPEHPGDRLSLRRVVRLPIAQRPFHGLAGEILSIGAVADAVSDVGVDAPDELLGILERVSPEHVSRLRSGERESL